MLTPDTFPELATALMLGIFIFVISWHGLQRPLLLALITFIPFQIIDSPYGSVNMAMTYVLGARHVP